MLTEKQSRRRLLAAGYDLRKSRVRYPNYYNMGGYMIVDRATGAVALGSRYDLDIHDVQSFVHDLSE